MSSLQEVCKGKGDQQEIKSQRCWAFMALSLQKAQHHLEHTKAKYANANEQTNKFIQQTIRRGDPEFPGFIL